MYQEKLGSEKVIKSERRKLKHEDSQRRLEFNQNSDLNLKQAVLRKQISIEAQLHAKEKQQKRLQDHYR